MNRFVHVSSVLSGAAFVVLLTLGVAASVDTAFADEPLTLDCKNQTDCPCPGKCTTDTIDCSGCICPSGTKCQ
jgi:hypothetical protein